MFLQKPSVCQLWYFCFEYSYGIVSLATFKKDLNISGFCHSQHHSWYGVFFTIYLYHYYQSLCLFCGNCLWHWRHFALCFWNLFDDSCDLVSYELSCFALYLFCPYVLLLSDSGNRWSKKKVYECKINLISPIFWWSEQSWCWCSSFIAEIFCTHSCYYYLNIINFILYKVTVFENSWCFIFLCFLYC